MEGIRQNVFLTKGGFLMIRGSLLECFPEALGTVCLTFAALETRVKIAGFFERCPIPSKAGGGAKSCADFQTAFQQSSSYPITKIIGGSDEIYMSRKGDMNKLI